MSLFDFVLILVMMEVLNSLARAFSQFFGMCSRFVQYLRGNATFAHPTFAHFFVFVYPGGLGGLPPV